MSQDTGMAMTLIGHRGFTQRITPGELAAGMLERY
jgi:hypothetical protein